MTGNPHYTIDENGYPTGGEEFSMGDVSAPASAQYHQLRRLNDDCVTPDVPSCMSG